MKNVGKKEKAQLLKIAEDLKLDLSQFTACLDSGKYKDYVTKDVEAGKSLG